jgi:cysteine desulfuration protein SufE
VREGISVTFPEKLQTLLELLGGLDRNDRIQMLIDLAERFRPVPARLAMPPYPADHRVPGCESEAYVWAEPNPDGTLGFYFAVENPQGISAMALASLLGESLSGKPLDQVAAVSPDIVYGLFGNELSMGKSLGLMGLVNMVRASVREHRARTAA